MSVELLSSSQEQLVEAIARRVVELLDERSGEAPAGLVDAATLARLLGVSRSTVYDHRAELGGVRLGEGTRGRLRFDVDEARAAWIRRVGRERSKRPEVPETPAVGTVVRRRRRSTGRSGGVLLPVRGEEAA